jgi:membrane-associated phospholipid phosphatase
MVLFFSICCCGIVHAQQPDSLGHKLDSLRNRGDSAAGREINVSKEMYTEKTRITPRVYFTLLGTDFVQEVTGPFHTPAKSWQKVAGFALVEGGLFLADKKVQKFATDLMERNDRMKNVSQYVTNFGGTYETYTLLGFAAYGYVFKSDKVKTTTWLATQSYLASGAMQFLLKYLTGEQRPNYVDPNNPMASPAPIFHGPAFSFKHAGSTTAFPSGHTTAIFAAATVFAQEYKDEILIPVISYSAATLVGLSRITQNAHWLSDVFAGAALGYITGLQVVRNYHRYAYLQNHKPKRASISFGVEYNINHVEPSVVIKFR